MNVVRAVDLERTFDGPPTVLALRGVDLTVSRGERLAVIGGSGAGKSTLLNILGLLDTPTGGTYSLLGKDVSTLDPRARDAARADAIGFVFQEAHVLGRRSVRANLEVKLAALSAPRGDRDRLAASCLDRVGLGHRVSTPAGLLSGGERQRLAIARAMLGRPALVLADEPTGSLDPVNTSIVLELLDQQAAQGAAVVVITHDVGVAGWADRSLTLREGLAVDPGSARSVAGSDRAGHDALR